MHEAGATGSNTPLLLTKQLSSVLRGSSLENGELQTHVLTMCLIQYMWSSSLWLTGILQTFYGPCVFLTFSKLTVFSF